MSDPRAAVARFYDLDRDPLPDLPFYISRIANANVRILELGCGTGRITLPLAQHCRFIQGIELSYAMLEICREKLRETLAPAEKVAIELGDITNFDLGATFDLIIAPYRVLQKVIYPDLVYRVREAGKLIEEVVFPLTMRCYFPDDFARLFSQHGFAIVDRWGGYAGELYGEGPELIIQARPA